MDVIAVQRGRPVKKLPNHVKQSGVAVIMALFIVTLVAILAYAMTIRLHKDIREAQWLDQHKRVERIAHGSVLGVMEKLRLSHPQEKKEMPVERFPMSVPVSEEQGYQVSSVVYDMTGLLNINALASEDVNEKEEAKQRWTCLLARVFPDWQNEKRMALVRAIREWVSATNAETQFDASYLKQPIPYRPRHGWMVSSSELRLVYGMDGESYKKLRPFVAALPASSQKKVNIMSVPLEVLSCLNPTMTPSSAGALIQMRDSKSFTNINAFVESPMVKSLNLTAANLTATGEYFLVVTQVAKDGKKQVFYTSLGRALDQGTSKLTVSILWQSKGVY